MRGTPRKGYDTMSSMQRRLIEAKRPNFGVFADTVNPADIARVVTAVQTSFEAFKVQNDARLAELAKGREDVVTKEHADRINAAVAAHAKDLEDMQRKLAALAVTGTADNKPLTAEKRAHSTAFHAMMRKGRDDGLRALEVKAALSSDSDPDGGFVVPEEMDTAITRVLETASVMRRIATVQNVSGPMFKAVHNLAGTGSGWVGESDGRPQTNTPQLTELAFPTMELYAMPAASQIVLDDARVSLETWLASEVQIAFAEQEGAAFINGNGTNRPKGFLTAPTVANASYTWGKLGFVKTGAAGAFPTSSATVNAYDKMVDVYHALKSGYRNDAVFVMNDLTLAELRKIKDAQGQYIYLPPTATEPGSILSKPVETDDNMPDIANNAFAIAFGSFKRGYLIVDRVGVRVLRDPYSAKPYVLFYTTKRVGGGIRDYAAIKLLQFAA